MPVDQNDIDLAMYLLDQSIYTGHSLNAQDAALVKKFIEALLEQQQRPTENVKSREWRAAVYRKLLEDPQALQQFVAPQLQDLIVDQQIGDMSIPDLVDLLQTHEKLRDVLEYAMEQDEEWVKEHFNLRERISNAYNTGLEEGLQGKQDEAEGEYERGYEDGYAKATKEE